MARMSMAEKMAKAVKPIAEEPAGEAESPAALHLVEDAPPAEAAAVAPAGVEPEPDTEAPAAVELAQPKRATKVTQRAYTPRPPAAAPAQAGEVATAAMQVELEMDLDARLVAYRASTKTAYHHIVLDAVEKTYPELPALVAKALGRETVEPAPVSLFTRTAAVTPINPKGRQDRALHTIRTTLSNRATLDKVADEVGAPSRNFMISVALDTYLPPHS